MVRFRNRYFLCEIISEDPRCPQFIEERIVHNAVKNAVARIHGDFGAACCSNAFQQQYGLVRHSFQYSRDQLLLRNCTSEGN